MYVFGGINGCIGKTAVAVNLFNISQLKKYVLMKKKYWLIVCLKFNYNPKSPKIIIL